MTGFVLSLSTNLEILQIKVQNPKYYFQTLLKNILLYIFR